MELEEIRRCVRELLPTEKRASLAFRAGVLLWSVLVVGTNLRRLQKFTGIPMYVVAEVSRNCRRWGVWGDNEMRYAWVEEPDDVLLTVGFVLDVLVAEGRVMRQTAWNLDGTPDYSYAALPETKRRAKSKTRRRHVPVGPDGVQTEGLDKKDAGPARSVVLGATHRTRRVDCTFAELQQPGGCGPMVHVVLARNAVRRHDRRPRSLKYGGRT